MLALHITHVLDPMTPYIIAITDTADVNATCNCGTDVRILIHTHKQLHVHVLWYYGIMDNDIHVHVGCNGL